MIQRIQTIFLILAAAVNITVLFLPLGIASNNDSFEGSSVTLTGMCVEKEGFDEVTFENVKETVGFSDDTFLMLHVLLVVLTSIYLIVLVFLYGDRARQIKMAYVGILLIMGQLLVAVLLFTQLPEMAGSPDDLQHDISYGFFVPAVALVLVWFAISRIKRDERLVKSSNRLR